MNENIITKIYYVKIVGTRKKKANYSITLCPRHHTIIVMRALLYIEIVSGSQLNVCWGLYIVTPSL